jgi:ATP-dependent DNA helicase RecG
MDENKRIEELRTKPEGQTFDRKSAKIDAKSLAVILVAMANADGGDIAIGIEDNGDVTGIDGTEQHINELLRAPFDFCVPSVEVDVEQLDCTGKDGQLNHILLMHVHQSMKLHANQADEAFYRIGDKSKKLSFEQRMQLLYAKGGRFYEDEPVYNATIDDIDLAKVDDYIKVLNYGKDAATYLRENKEFVTNRDGVEKVSGAAILLFGKKPQQFFPRSYVRFIRYEGTEAKVGTEMNVVKDVIFEGTVLEVINKAIVYVQTQIKEYTFLGSKGLFVTIPEYPEFCWQELIVNAVAHRDYSIYGTDIQIKLFDDHFTVESPGFLPGLVRTYNIRHIHFSRNPKIAAYLRDYKIVKEFGEGVDRMYREMQEAGQPEPQYVQDDFILKATLKAKALSNSVIVPNQTKCDGKIHEKTKETSKKHPRNIQETSKKHPRTVQEQILNVIRENPFVTRKELEVALGYSEGKIKYHIETLATLGVIRHEGPTKAGKWIILKQSKNQDNE